MKRPVAAPAAQAESPSDACSGGSCCVTPDPIGVIEEEHALQNELCNILESIADGLPGFDTHLASVAISILESSLPQHVRLEDEALFPILRARVAPEHPVIPVLDCLESDHVHQAGTLDELVHTLNAAVKGEAECDAEVLGYVLRGFFEDQRRHIEWENKAILPVARAVLTDADLATLQSWIMSSDSPRCTHQSLVMLLRAPSVNAVCIDCSAKAAAPDGATGKDNSARKPI